jgi:prepilin-type N-terminal cleavage/methylation domain-containing protein
MHHRSRAFTLVEVLMVLAIIGISTVIAMPSLVRSIRGNRLRVGARVVVMAGNYARTTAILRNQEMKLILDKSTSTVTVEPLWDSAAPPHPEDRGFTDLPPTNPPPSAQGDMPPPPEEPSSALPPVRIVRQLDAVHIDSVSIDHKKDSPGDEPAVVVYQSNGRCNPYEVRVLDEFGSAMIITVDAVASAKVKQEGE